MHPIKVKEPLELLGVDLIGPLPVSDEGFRYACTFVDFYTKFVDFFPLKDKSAFGVSKCILSFIHRWGKPGRILSDQECEFCASVNDELCKAYGIKRSVTSAYHPQTNGLAERTNRTLKTRLAKLCNTKMSDWPDYLEEVAYSMRTQKQKSTGFTPYHLMFGRQHRPIDQDDMELEVEEEGLSPADESTDTSCHEEKVNAAQERQTADYNRRKKKGSKIYDLSVGMHVLQSNLRNESMEPKWTGPYKILDIDCNQRVALETVKNGKKLNRRVSYNQLRPLSPQLDSLHACQACQLTTRLTRKLRPLTRSVASPASTHYCTSHTYCNFFTDSSCSVYYFCDFVDYSAPAKTATMEEDRKSYKASTDSPLLHGGDEEVTGEDVGEREGEVVGDTTPTYGERQFGDFSPHPLPAFQQEQQMPVLSPHPQQPQPATSTV
ncbi:hypothetical protein Pcinc_018768 [Petrolisthes cinctipes]|uniref:Integrase catalytic domain-containing protein n=1 Tax=Petrolisthes cinctipes TaxID=88211 RepID=A0AAE1FNG6_PETCI|nr:hypothetical protein Pcinc_018768 [Petrolisthes cinctipes]